MKTTKKTRKPLTLEDEARFWDSVQIPVEVMTGCWTWKKKIDPSTGYVRFGVGGKTGSNYLGHRLAYTLVRGEIPAGKDLDHLCRNRGCVNPHHLEPVTRAENARRGAGTKLNVSKVVRIKALIREGFSPKRIAQLFRISQGAIHEIKRGHNWKEVMSL